MMSDLRCIIVTRDLDENGKEAVNILQEIFIKQQEEYNEAFNRLKAQIEWYQKLVERLVEIIERKE